MNNLKVFYINLDRDTARRTHMEQTLTKLGFVFERMAAIDGSKINIEQYHDGEVTEKEGGDRMTVPEIGCAASHREIYRRIVNEQIPYTLVLEDDIETIPDFKLTVERLITEHNHNSTWDYLTFDYAESGSIFLKRWLFSVFLQYQKKIRGKYWYHNIDEKIKYIISSIVKFLYIAPLTYLEYARNWYYKTQGMGAAVRFARPLYFAGCYLITLEGAKALLSLAEPYLVYTADRLPNQARRLAALRMRGYAPISAFQRRKQFGSNIGTGIDFSDYRETIL